MGHGFCGGCAAALTGQFDDAAHGEGHFIADWIEMLREARDKVRAEHGEDFRAMELEARPGQPRQSAHLPLGARARGATGASSSTAPISPSPTASSTCSTRRSGEFAPA